MTRWHWQSVLACPARGDGHDATGEPGDCFRTALADVLGVDPAGVPNFVRYLSWWDEARRWVRANAGLDLLWVEPEDPWRNPYAGDGPEHVLAQVLSVRGAYHHEVVLDPRTLPPRLALPAAP